VPGLIDVLRKNGVVVANMPGSAWMEARALLGFSAQPQPSFLREDLKMRTSRPGGAARIRPRGSVVAARRGCHRGAYAGAFPVSQRSRAARRVVGKRARTAQVGDQRSGHRLCRPELVRLSTTPVCGTRGASRAAICAAGVRRRHSRRLGPSCPAAFAGSPTNSMPAPCRWAMARGRRRLGWSPTRRCRRQRCCRRGTACGSAASRLGAEPLRRQSVLLGRYLERAEGDAAAGAGARTQRDPGKGSSTVLHSVERFTALVTWGATSQATRAQPAEGGTEALQSQEKFGSALSLLRRHSEPRHPCGSVFTGAWQVITGDDENALPRSRR